MRENIDNKKVNSYRQILMNTSLLGSVQIINIIVQILKSKLIAILLGTTGFGVYSLYISTSSLVTSVTNLGLGTSAVRNISEAYAVEDSLNLNVTVNIFQRWICFTGILGMIVLLLGAKWFSIFTFNSESYSFELSILSISILLTQLSVGQNVILQGTRKLKLLAQSNVIGVVLGLIVSIPLYYFYGIESISYSVVLSSAFLFCTSFYFSRSLKIPHVSLSLKNIFYGGCSMVKMGVLISLSGIISLFSSYLLRVFMSHQSGVGEVGLYSAGFAIINTYVGLIFTAMSSDYFPRLSAVACNNSNMINVVNKQIEISLLILSPVLLLFLIFIKWGIVLLYSDQFLQVTGMVQWAVLGMFFKAMSWAISFSFLAKKDSVVFFKNELAANIYMLIFNLLGYYYYGLDGVGMSFAVGYLFYFLHVYYVGRRYYQYEISKSAFVVLVKQSIVMILCFVSLKYCLPEFEIIIGIPFLLLSTIFTIIDIKTLFVK